MAYKKIHACRICSNPRLVPVVDLGAQVLTGVFPKQKGQEVEAGPVSLVKCDNTGIDACGLLQMECSFSLDAMYGDNYGYRSGLNASMVKHLRSKIDRILSIVDFTDNPLVVDIGSNDGTSLSFYPAEKCTRVGIDPTAEKFRAYYQPGIHIIPHFFSFDQLNEQFPGKKARVVTSFSMFYDLEQPLEFAKQVAKVLDRNGVWVFEQSYMPAMLDRNSFDTACHEHLEYYAYKQIKWILDRCGLKAVDVEFNDVNGGSFSVMAAPQESIYPTFAGEKALLASEMRLDNLDVYRQFSARIDALCAELKQFVARANSMGKRVAALGASTKGNVLLQYCGFTERDLFAVAEVNEEKFGCYTPGSLIPIRPDAEVISKADYLIVLPWHFKDFFLQRYAYCAHKLVFPLPQLEIRTALAS
jgi:NDP-4-keto-2,6-dideoxyhexose 3-C-methyltransferase